MRPQFDDPNLKRFQENVDIESLLHFVRSGGRDEEIYKAALDDLKPILDALSFGWRPIYKNLDLTALQGRMTEVTDIVIWMAGSDSADMKSTAIELMGILGWEAFIPLLRQHFSSEAEWERIAAIRALGQFTGDFTSGIFHAAAEYDSSQEVRDVARQLLKLTEGGN